MIIKFFHSLIVTFKQPRKDMKSRSGLQDGDYKTATWSHSLADEVYVDSMFRQT